MADFERLKLLLAESEKFRGEYSVACCGDSEILGNFFIAYLLIKVLKKNYKLYFYSLYMRDSQKLYFELAIGFIILAFPIASLGSGLGNMSFSESLFHRDLIILFWIPSLICLFSALILFIKGKNILYFSMVLPIIGFLLMVYYTAVVLSALTDSLLLLLLYCSLLIRGIYVTIKDIKKEQ